MRFSSKKFHFGGDMVCTRSRPTKKTPGFMNFEGVCGGLNLQLWERWTSSVPRPASVFLKIKTGKIGGMAIAKKNIRKGTFIGKYFGRVTKVNNISSPNYAIDLGRFNFLLNGATKQKASSYVVDGSSLNKKQENNAVFLNHSCKNSNCTMWAESHTKKVSYKLGGIMRYKTLTCNYVALFAARAIKKGEELLSNYDDIRGGRGPFYFDSKEKQQAVLKKSTLKGKVTRCLCAADCSRYFIKY